MRRTLKYVSLLAWLLMIVQTAAGQDRPSFSIGTDEAYDPSVVPAYAGDHQDVYSHIDGSIDQHIRALQRWMRQPSISAQNVGIHEMADMLRDDLRKIGFQESELVATGGHPGVWGYYDAGAERTLLVYMMYDVQPVNPEDWESPPFEAELVENELGRVIMARGATNQKGPERAFLNALESIIAVEGKLPLNVMIAAEGEEELGSPNYARIVDAYEDRMRKADGVLFPMSVQSPDGGTNMLLGVKGILYFEMEARGGPWGGPQTAEIHGSWKAVVDSPTLRLVQALASLTTADGNTIRVPAYYDGIRPPTEEEQQLINGAAAQRDERQARKAAGVERFIDDLEGRDAIVEMLYMPTLNINGIWSGYTGEGVKTILPHIATAKVDSRLPVGLDPDRALEKIRAHLDANGFADIVIRKLSGYPAAQTSVHSELAQAVISVYNKYSQELSIQPRIGGSAPFYQFTERLGLPLVPAGLGYGRGAHAPNEIYLVEPAPGVPIAGLAEIEKAYVDLLFALAGQ
ncbi:MAG: M20/M25/M40 family metallo-hydrolase [Xanthomonadales bacterium]|nr:M20/M25/M40 family metallo-hydrolase [Xanthomonadales bacterium]